MKNVITALFVLSVFTFTACKKETDIDSSSFSCKIDGTNYNVKGITAYAVDFGGDFTVYGVNEDNNTETVYITFPAGTTTGTYPLDADVVGYYVDPADVAYSNLWGQGA